MAPPGGPSAVATAERPRGRSRARRRDGIIVDHRLAFAGIVLFAIVLRFVDISSHISLDDGYSYLVGSAPNAHEFLHRLAGSENTPPLFYLLLTPLPIHHEAWLRMPAAVPGVLMCVVLYLILRRRLGTTVALLASLCAAVSPFLVTYSNLARGFMLADLALLCALGAMLELLDGRSQKWWLAYLASGVVAIYAEYDAAIFLIALTVSAVALSRPAARIKTAVLGIAPLVSIIPWIPQIVDAQNAVGKTKLEPSFGGPSITTLRETFVTLVFGENGGTASAAGRWLEFALIAAVIAGGALVLARAPKTQTTAPDQARRAITLLAWTTGLTFIGHALAAPLGVHVFDQRYLTLMIPLVGALLAAAIVALDRRWLVYAAALALSVLGVVNVARRYHHQFEPDPAPVRAAALALHPRTVLTDTPVIVYYLGALHPQLDRPFNLGPGRAGSCAKPCLIIDDVLTRTGTPRPVSGTSSLLEGRYLVTLER